MKRDEPMSKTFEVGYMLNGQKRYKIVPASTAWEAGEYVARFEGVSHDQVRTIIELGKKESH